MLCRTRSSNGSSQSAPSNGVDGALLVGSVMAWAPCDGRPAVALRVVSHQELTPPSPIPTNPATRPRLSLFDSPVRDGVRRLIKDLSSHRKDSQPSCAPIFEVYLPTNRYRDLHALPLGSDSVRSAGLAIRK